MGLFLDILHVPVSVTNAALDGIYKAISTHDHGGNGWKPHESVLIRRLVELFTQRGLDRLAAVQSALSDWRDGRNYVPSDAPAVMPPTGAMQRWNADELALARVYLESLPVAQWTLDDHMLAIDLTVQTYLPQDVMQSESEWLAVRAGMMGRVQANMIREPSAKDADKILAALPSTVAGAVAQFKMSAQQHALLDFARVRAAENVRALSESVRHKMRVLITDDLEQRVMGAPVGTSSLETKLFDTFGDLNRDWRRIAVTEAGEAQLQSFVASLKSGTKIKRIEQYEDACGFCRKIDGKVVTVVSPDAPNKNPDTMVWAGKNNIGRSASPRKRVGNLLVAREPEEMWQVPAGLSHPNCRGRWVVVDDGDFGDDEFGRFLAETLTA